MLWSLSPIFCTKIEGAEAPVLQLPQEVPGAHALCQVQLTLPVEPQDILKNPGWAIKVELLCSKWKGVT